MTVKQLHQLLHELNDTHEVVVSEAPQGDVALAVWRIAAADAHTAYAAWAADSSLQAYTAYRAAEDRADAALEALAGHASIQTGS
jgi:hypothetical protein